MSETFAQAWTTLPNSPNLAYAEIHIDAFSAFNSHFYFGVTPTNGTPTSAGYAIRWDGTLFPSGSGPALGIGNVIQFAYNQTAGNLWIGVNGTWVGGGNPASNTTPTFTGLSGTAYVSVEMGEFNTGGATGRFNSAQFTLSVPSGFSSWSGM